MNLDNVQVLNASAGTGKTTRLIEELKAALDPTGEAPVPPEKVMITTFTEKAASEIQERARTALLEAGFRDEARRLEQALIGTVHHIGNRLAEEYAFELGTSPVSSIIPDEDSGELFNRAIEESVDPQFFERMEGISRRLGIQDQDWTGTLNELVSKARANGLDDERMKECGEEAADELLGRLPEADGPEDPERALKERIETLLRAIEASNDETKATRGGKDHLARIKGKLEHGRELTWKEWFDLQELNLSAQWKENPEKQDLIAFAGDHLRFPAFHQDLRNYIEGLFSTGSMVLNSYSRIKKERGLVDYTDMEVQLLNIFQHSQLQEELRERISFLMVDEFQDSSPLQIKVFLKAVQFADRAVWVGDPKQSIYAFRDTDPELMEKVLEEAPYIDDLPKNFRTRPELNRLVGDLFEGRFAFEQGAGVKVETARSNEGLETPLLFWCTPNPNGKPPPRVQEQALAIAEGIRLSLNDRDNYPVYDKGLGKIRSLKGGDVAVLCRSKDKVKKVSEALERMGIPSVSPGSGLLRTAEGVLLHAAMRYLNDAGDRLAVFEMKLLWQGDGDVGRVLEERLTFLENASEEEVWGTDNPLVQRIDAERTKLRNASVPTLVSKLISLLDLHYLLAHWGKLAQRKANLDELLRLANEYEESCLRMKKASTLSGFLLYLEELRQKGEDLVASFQGEEAVWVNTYHQAKGLEWPMVVLHELEQKLEEDPKKDLFGKFRSSFSEEGMDLQDPLQGRKLSYWPYPYGRKSKVPDAFSEGIGDARDQAHRQKLEEEKRLLYVGFTRSRDYLVIPYYEKEVPWIKKNLELDLSEHVPSDGGAFQFQPGSEQEAISAKGIHVPVPEETHSFQREAVEHYPMPEGPKEYADLRVSPSQLSQASPEIDVEPMHEGPLHDRLTNESSIKDQELGDAFHAVLALHPEILKEDAPKERIEAVLAEYGLKGTIDGGLFHDNLQAFEAFIQDRWNIEERHKEWPLAMQKDGQLYQGYADLVLRTSEGLVLIDHKSNRGGKDRVMQKAPEHAAQLATYKEMLEQATRQKVLATCLYYGVSGLMLEVKE